MVPLDTRPSTLNTGPSITPPPQPSIAQPMSYQHERANSAQEISANIIPTSTKQELAMYLHQCLCSPPKSALLKAICNKQLDSIPGLTYDLIAKHLPPSTATGKVHMIRTRQVARSTRRNHKVVKDARAQVDNMSPPEQVCTAIDNEMFCFAILADQNENTIYSDLAGRFPVLSYSSMNYIFCRICLQDQCHLGPAHGHTM